MATVPETQPNVEAIRNDPLNTAPPADGAAAQINEVETAAQEEQKKEGMDHKAGMEPPKQEEPEPEPEEPFSLGGPGNAPVSPQSMSPGSVSAGPDALNDLNRQFGR